MTVRVEEFDYDLPPQLIAQTPLADRAASRLMVVDPVESTIRHTQFYNLVNCLSKGDVLVFNNSKVLPARLHGEKEGTGGKIELLLTKRVSTDEWEVLAKPAKRLRVGTRIRFESSGVAHVTNVHADGLRVVRFDLSEPMEAFLDRVGEMPLPPYIHEPLQQRDRYQTVYAQETGSVAAPTAGLHFTEDLLQELRNKGVELTYVTLHVGLGTFKPVTVSEVESHHMHTESYEVPAETAAIIERAKQEGRRVIAVGTTALRTLESAWQDGRVRPGAADTGIFIYPGYRFRVVDALVTNFHLPKSTLLMLVAAFMGLSMSRRTYDCAVREQYRFFSFGDAMFITRRAEAY